MKGQFKKSIIGHFNIHLVVNTATKNLTFDLFIYLVSIMFNQNGITGPSVENKLLCGNVCRTEK